MLTRPVVDRDGLGRALDAKLNDWKRLLPLTTYTRADGAPEPDRQHRLLSKERQFRYAQGWRFIPLPVRRPASRIRRTTASGTGFT